MPHALLSVVRTGGMSIAWMVGVLSAPQFYGAWRRHIETPRAPQAC